MTHDVVEPVCCSADPENNPACRDNPDCCIHDRVILSREEVERVLDRLKRLRTINRIHGNEDPKTDAAIKSLEEKLAQVD